MTVLPSHYYRNPEQIMLDREARRLKYRYGCSICQDMGERGCRKKMRLKRHWTWCKQWRLTDDLDVLAML